MNTHHGLNNWLVAGKHLLQRRMGELASILLKNDSFEKLNVVDNIALIFISIFSIVTEFQ